MILEAGVIVAGWGSSTAKAAIARKLNPGGTAVFPSDLASAAMASSAVDG